MEVGISYLRAIAWVAGSILGQVRLQGDGWNGSLNEGAIVPRFQGYLSDRDIREYRDELFPNDSREIHPEGASVESSPRVGVPPELTA